MRSRYLPSRTPEIYNGEPRGVVCTLAATHYIVTGSVGVEALALQPLKIALNTGAGYNIIRRDVLPFGWEEYVDDRAHIPKICDANGNALRIGEVVWLRVRLGNATYRVNFLVADKLAVDVLMGTCFLNKHGLAIKCTAQQVRLRGSTIPNLGTRLGPHANQKGKGPAEDEEEDEVEDSYWKASPAQVQIPDRRSVGRTYSLG